MVKCGETYTVGGTEDNELIFWGTRMHKQSLSNQASRSPSKDGYRSDGTNAAPTHSRQPSTASACSVTSLKDLPDSKDSENHFRQHQTQCQYIVKSRAKSLIYNQIFILCMRLCI